MAHTSRVGFVKLLLLRLRRVVIADAYVREIVHAGT